VAKKVILLESVQTMKKGYMLKEVPALAVDQSDIYFVTALTTLE
jgi:hypothetical protein